MSAFVLVKYMASKGVKQTEKHKRNISKAVSGENHYNWGKHLSEETKKKVGRNWRGKRGAETNQWKGGRRKIGKYVYVYSPDHPNRTSQRYVAEHRLIMEKKLERYLTKEEVVHHINRITDDNRIENLQLFSSSTEHLKYHRELKLPAN